MIRQFAYNDGVIWNPPCISLQRSTVQFAYNDVSFGIHMYLLIVED